MDHVFVGFGFGPIQAGLFAKEARDSGSFSEIVVAEIDPSLVLAVRGAGDRYALNVACADHVEAVTVEGVTLLNPSNADDLRRLRDALGRATEIVTSLPSVDFFARGRETSVARLIAEGLRTHGAERTVVYTAENNNHAAEILEREVGLVTADQAALRPVQFLNTVIGKMSQVVTGAEETKKAGLMPVVPDFARAFLIEAFNRILVSRIRLPGFVPGISAFEEKDDLLPFEEAKLFGHNAAHTMLGFLGAQRGACQLSELRGQTDVMDLVRRAFLDESGAALIARHSGLGDALFTSEGFRAYVDDLLARMTNPHLADTVARAIRDPMRKLGCSDRLFGALRLCLSYGIEPACLAVGSLAGLRSVCDDSFTVGELKKGRSLLESRLCELWGSECPADERSDIAALLQRAQPHLESIKRNRQGEKKL